MKNMNCVINGSFQRFGGVFVEGCEIEIPFLCISIYFLAHGSTCGWLSPFSSVFNSHEVFVL